MLNRALPLSLLSACSLVVLAARPAAQGVPSPRAVFGHEIGADGFLADYTQLRAYWARLAAASDRLIVERIGETSYGQPMEIAVISSPANLARLPRLREIGHRLSRGRDASEVAIRELCAEGRAVVWIDAGMHATEAVAAQNIIELTYRMTGRDDDEVRRILDEVVLLVCPANPDGMELVARAYIATGRVGGLPVLYQRYIGHDNNRDHYAGNQLETRAIARALYHRWNPQIVYNHHQSAPRGTVIFTPPFRDPFNYNVDPLVVRGIELVSAHMNHRFSAEGKPGAISRTGASYSTWWNGGLRTTVYFHNMIGILTESFGRPDPTPLTQSLDRRLPHSDYPDPVPSQVWHARQTIEYLQTANFAILDLAARYRREFLRNHWRMARNSVERGSRPHWTVTPRLMATARDRDRRARSTEGASEVAAEGSAAEPVDAFADPDLQDARAYVLPADQPDFAAATRLVRALLRTGVEVDVAESELRRGARSYPAGSYVVSAAQAFRPHVRDMFEPQWHPDDRRDGGEPVRPYDSAGWTLAMQMGARFERLYDDVDGALRRIEEIEVPFPAGRVSAGRAGYLLSHADGNTAICVNRLLAAGDRVHWLAAPVTLAGVDYPAGTVFVGAAPGTAERLAACAAELGVAATGVDGVPASRALALRPVRVGLYVPWGGDMATGWAQWVLEQFEFAVEPVYGARIEAGDLAADYDVLVFHRGLPATSRGERTRNALRRGGRGSQAAPDLDELRAALPPFEDWSDLEARHTPLTAEAGVAALRAFVEHGGTLLALDSAVPSVVRHFELPVETGVFVEAEGSRRRATSSEFFVPSSLLWLDVDGSDPLGYGVPARIATMFSRSEVLTPGTGAAAVARYPAEGELLASGWAIGVELLHGAAAVVTAELGKGRVHLYGADVLFRGQPLASFKLVFNAIQAAGARQVSRPR